MPEEEPIRELDLSIGFVFHVVCFEQDGAFYIVANLITEYTTVNHQMLISVSQTLRSIVQAASAVIPKRTRASADQRPGD